jgi:hypothetical protein
MSAIGRVGSVKPTTSGADLKELLVPYPADQMELWPVDKPVGSVKNEFLFYVLRRHRLRHVTISLRRARLSMILNQLQASFYGLTSTSDA